MEICENWNQLLKEWNCLISLPSLIHFSLFLFTPALPNGPDEEKKRIDGLWAPFAAFERAGELNKAKEDRPAPTKSFNPIKQPNCWPAV